MYLVFSLTRNAASVRARPCSRQVTVTVGPARCTASLPAAVFVLSKGDIFHRGSNATD